MSQSEKKNWLERLQRESWELELLISGFVLILLLQLPAQITSLWLDFKLSFSLSLTTFRVFFFAALFYSFKLVSFVLIFHSATDWSNSQKIVLPGHCFVVHLPDLSQANAGAGPMLACRLGPGLGSHTGTILGHVAPRRCNESPSMRAHKPNDDARYGGL